MSGSNGRRGSAQPNPAQGEAVPLSVTVPAYAGTLAPTQPARLRALRRHLVAAMRDARELPRPAGVAAAATVEPAGFTGRVARAACALCQGWCCSKGGEHAYLDGPSMARVRRVRPELDAWGILRLYMQAAAGPGYAGSCVFHGAQGCTLERSLRSDLCNRYFCNGLGRLMKQTETPQAVTLIAAASGIPHRSCTLARDDPP